VSATTDYERNAIELAMPTRTESSELKVLNPEDLIVFKLIALPPTGQERVY
jgi:hypothetical protein